MKRIFKQMQEVETVKIFCDLCGSNDHMPRYAENRVCNVCGRDACGKCQGPYPDEEIADDVICKNCKALESKFQPLLNEAYQERERIRARWKEESKHAILALAGSK